ncbi:MAG TPA: hypothetical protein VF074_10650, partial [Pyrinomonadaceae bacterium]
RPTRQPEMVKALIVILTAASVVIAQGICNRFQPVAGRCDLNATPAEQAKCLLRPVKKFAKLGPPLTALPAPLDTLVGQPTEPSFTLEQLKQFLVAKRISEADVGGSLSIKLTAARYFVIHDTSDFQGDSAAVFPSSINDAGAQLNKLSRRVNQKVCHVYINRVGQSATAVVFESLTPPNGTKFGRCNPSKRTAFLHIENIQPRIRDRSVNFANDAIAPEPGFTDSQLERLALVYLVASARAGKWLIPAYHSPVDLGFPDAHDDPQNFNLNQWALKLEETLAAVRAIQ